jgi:hypothetical protein
MRKRPARGRDSNCGFIRPICTWNSINRREKAVNWFNVDREAYANLTGTNEFITIGDDKKPSNCSLRRVNVNAEQLQKRSIPGNNCVELGDQNEI